MDRGRRIRSEEKAEILGLRGAGVAVKEIARRLKVHYRTARRWADPENHSPMPMSSDIENRRQLTLFESRLLCEAARLSLWSVKELRDDIVSYLFERIRRTEEFASERSCRRAITCVGLKKYRLSRERHEIGSLAVHFVPIKWEEKKFGSEDFQKKKGGLLILMERRSGFIQVVRINHLSFRFLLAKIHKTCETLYRDFLVTVKRISFVTYRRGDEILSTALDLDMNTMQSSFQGHKFPVEFDEPTSNGIPIYLGRFDQKGDLGKRIRIEEDNYNFGINGLPLYLQGAGKKYDASTTIIQITNEHGPDKCRKVLPGELRGFSRVSSRLQAHLAETCYRIKSDVF